MNSRRRAPAFEQASKFAPDRDDLKFHIAWIAERQNSPAEAEALYANWSRKILISKTRGSGWAIFAWIAETPPAASQPFEKCVEKRADWPEAEINLALAHWRLGQFTHPNRFLKSFTRGIPNRSTRSRAWPKRRSSSTSRKRRLRYHRMLIDAGQATPQVLYNSGVLAHQLNDPAGRGRTVPQRHSGATRFPGGAAESGPRARSAGPNRGRPGIMDQGAGDET